MAPALPRVLHRGPGFEILGLVTGPLDNNVLVVHDLDSGDAVIVDAADDAGAIERAVTDLHVDAILTTHGHWDHHQAAPAVAAALGVRVQLHPDDAGISDLVADPLVPGERLVGSTDFTVVHTPGHTPGSVCILLDGVALTGDTLFPGGPGATRFEHSDFDRIIHSIRSELFSLPDDTVVIPGHGASTTIGTERPQLQDWIDRRW